ncbi:MAG: hypothetical protein FWD25_05550 [Clostridia bacterium]|nr:hypothetical protein [Clostridia bacterium]
MKKAFASALAIVLVFALTVFAAQAEMETVSGATPQVPDEALIQQIDSYFTMTKNEILAKHGPGYVVEPTGPEGICDGYFYEDLGMAFAFYPDEDTLELIACDENFTIRGVGVGSLFWEIMESLGHTEIIETWMEHPDFVVYLMEYHWGDSVYSFISFDLNEPVHLFWIYQRP